MDKNSIKFTIFFIIVLFIIVGGFILMKKSENMDKKDNYIPSKEEKIKDIRLDKEKDYIYFTNREVIIGELDIEYSDININFTDPSDIAKTLNDESKNFKEAITYDENLEDPAYNKLSSAKYKKMATYTFDNYLSLVIDYYSYDPENRVSYEKTSTFVFDKKTGNLLSPLDLLSKFNLSEEDLKNKVRTHVADQDLVKEGETLDPDATVNNLTTYALYVDKLGSLTISVLVKSDQKDYNDIITLS